MKHDQHFMVDEKLASRIVDYANLSAKDKVLEIGPGNGALTKYLVKKSKVTAVEIDPKLCEKLEKLKFKNLKVVNENALNFKDDFDVVVSNLPYSLCEPYFNKLIKKDFKRGVFCVPLSFANRITKEKSFLSIVIPLFFKVKILEEVPKNAFSPPPKTESVVIRIEKRENITLKSAIIKELYLQTDKKVKSALEETYCRSLSISKKQARDKIPKLDFLDKRVYMLNYDEWKELISSI